MLGRRDGWSLRVCGVGVLREVDSGRLVLGADAESHQPVDRLGQRIRHDEGAPVDHHDAERLLAVLSKPSAIDDVLFRSCRTLTVRT
jgi:hypothetical protein